MVEWKSDQDPSGDCDILLQEAPPILELTGGNRTRTLRGIATFFSAIFRSSSLCALWKSDQDPSGDCDNWTLPIPGMFWSLLWKSDQDPSGDCDTMSRSTCGTNPNERWKSDQAPSGGCECVTYVESAESQDLGCAVRGGVPRDTELLALRGRGVVAAVHEGCRVSNPWRRTGRARRRCSLDDRRPDRYERGRRYS